MEHFQLSLRFKSSSGKWAHILLVKCLSCYIVMEKFVVSVIGKSQSVKCFMLIENKDANQMELRDNVERRRVIDNR